MHYEKILFKLMNKKTAPFAKYAKSAVSGVSRQL
jgi:hypothetical protein